MPPQVYGSVISGLGGLWPLWFSKVASLVYDSSTSGLWPLWFSKAPSLVYESVTSGLWLRRFSRFPVRVDAHHNFYTVPPHAPTLPRAFIMAAALWCTRWQEVLGTTHKWPYAIRELIFTWGARHLKRKERFAVVVFMMTNGARPELIVQWFRENPHQLDKKGMENVNYIIREFPRKGWRAWDVTLGHSN